MNKKIMWEVVGVLILGLAIFALASINKQEREKDNSKLHIVTTLFPLYDFAKEIGGEKVEVFLLLPPGVESHGFEPKPSDIIKINESDIFVYTGKYMETWAEDIIKGITNKNVKVVDSSSGIELMKEDDEHKHEHDHVDNSDEHVITEPEESGHDHGGVDPHIWLDFDNAQIMVDNIAMAMMEKDQTNADYYNNQANEYKHRLIVLDNNYRDTLVKCNSKEIVYGGHYAFGYMTKRYGLTYTTAQGFSPDSEPTANDLVTLVNQIKNHDIKYVFYEELASPKIAETLTKETGTQMLLLNGTHNLTKEDFQNNTTYITLMENNLKNLAVGLVCN